MPATGTANTTGFARDTLTATALILDALAVVGTERRTTLSQALRLLYAAAEESYGPEELALATALVDVIKDYERKGQNR